jgi:predicted transglutaminase-like cysteine proteinase
LWAAIAYKTNFGAHFESSRLIKSRLKVRCHPALDRQGDKMLGRFVFAVFCVALTLAIPPDGAAARGGQLVKATQSTLDGASATLAPFQHVRFCLRYPQDCQSSAKKAEPITPQMMGLLQSVNDNVNRAINPSSEDYNGGWTIAPNIGDCNDYAVTKRHELLMRGLPPGVLRLSVTKTPTGIGHLLLVVTTTRGNMVMDNLTNEIRPWEFTGYRLLKIQSAADPQLWVTIKKAAANANASGLLKSDAGEGTLDFHRAMTDKFPFPG